MSYWGYKQPPPGTRIDQGGPFSAGMVCALLPGDNYILYDGIASYRFGKGTRMQRGKYGRMIGNWSIPVNQCLSINFPTQDFTAIGLMNVQAIPTGNDISYWLSNEFYVSNTNNGGWACSVGSPSNQFPNYGFQSWSNDYPSNCNTSVGSVTLGDHFVGGGLSGSSANRIIYQDGASASSASHVHYPLASTAGLSGIDGNPTKVNLYVAYIWNYALPSQLLLKLREEPFAPWAPPSANVTTFVMPGVTEVVSQVGLLVVSEANSQSVVTQAGMAIVAQSTPEATVTQMGMMSIVKAKFTDYLCSDLQSDLFVVDYLGS